MQYTPNERPQGPSLAHYNALVDEKRQVRHTASVTGLACLSIVVCSFLVNAAHSMMVALGLVQGEIAGWIAELIGDVFIFLPPCLILYFALRRPFPLRSIFTAPNDGRVSALAVPILLGGTLLSSILMNLLTIVLGSFGLVPDNPAYAQPQSSIGFVLYLLSMTIFPAFFEELFFRGFALKALRRYGDTFAIIMSAFLFGLLHRNLLQFVNAFILGLVLGYFVVRTDSLLTGILMHFFNNLFYTMLDTIPKAVPNEHTQTLIIVGAQLVLLMLAILATVLLMLINRRAPAPAPTATRSTLHTGEKVITGLCSVGMLAAIIYCGIQIVLRIHLA